MVKAIADKVLAKIIDPAEVVSMVAELYRNEAMAGETVCIH